jgi:hypothetical protein
MSDKGEAKKALDALRDRHPDVYRDIVERQYDVVNFSPADVDGVDVLDLGAHVGIFTLFCLSHGARSVPWRRTPRPSGSLRPIPGRSPR